MEHNLKHFIEPIKRGTMAEALGQQQANSVIFELRRAGLVELQIGGYFQLTRLGRVHYERYLGIAVGAQWKVYCGDCIGCQPGTCKRVFP